MAALRADAQRNLDRVLVAAGEAFAEFGPDVSVNEIARRAGVGHGTVFRRFPSKESLIAAVVNERLVELACTAEELLEQEDAGAAFEAFVWQAAETHARDRALFEGMHRCGEMLEVVEEKRRLAGFVGLLVSRAQDQGALRADVDPDDVQVLVGAAIAGSFQASAPDAWQRYIRIVLDGLRAPARG
jgi:AcrR family transcriptional regulator